MSDEKETAAEQPRQSWIVLFGSMIKPLFRFDCFFSLVALLLIFGFFFYIVEKVTMPNVALSDVALTIIGTILGTIAMFFKELSTWIFRTAKATIDKRKDEKPEETE